MPRYETQDIAFEYPRGWDDRTIMAVAPAGTKTNVVVTRDKLPDGEDLRRYADRQLVQMAKTFLGFQLFDRKETTLHNHPAVDVRLGWRGSDGTPLIQRLVMTARDERVFNFTCTTTKKEAPEFGPIFDRVLASVSIK